MSQAVPDSPQPVRVAMPVPRALSIALLLSVALNVLLAAAIGAGLWKARQAQQAGPIARLPGVAAIARVLPPRDRPVLFDALRARRGTIRDAMVEVRQARLAVRDALAARDYDSARAERAFTRLREREAALSAEVQAALLEAGPRLSPEGREAISRAGQRAEQRARRRARW